MDTVKTLWVTPHGLRKLQHERSDLVHWLHHIAHRLRGNTFNDPSIALRERQVIAGRLERIDQLLGEARQVPPSWQHKLRAQVGDTVFLRCKDAIRALRIVQNEAANPREGNVAIDSPLGRSLLGKMQGSHVQLATLEGYKIYEVLKIL